MGEAASLTVTSSLHQLLAEYSVRKRILRQLLPGASKKRLRALEGSCPAPSEPSQGAAQAQGGSGWLRLLRVQHKLRIASFRLPDCFLQAAAFRLLHSMVSGPPNEFSELASVSKSRARQQKLGDTSSNELASGQIHFGQPFYRLRYA